jgi:hypothetical protein
MRSFRDCRDRRTERRHTISHSAKLNEEEQKGKRTPINEKRKKE